MQDSEIYTKTEAGREEIRTRALKLSMPMRAILLMVDGQRTVADLRGLIAGSKAPAEALDTLLSQGLIAGTHAASPAASLAVPAPLPTPAAPPAAAPYVPQAPSTPPAQAPVIASTMATAASPPAAPEPTALAQPPATDSHGEMGDPKTRFDRLYTAMNEIVRDFLPAHRRYFIQLKIERCNTAEELLEVMHDLRTALAKARGDAFATDVVARLRVAAI